MRITGKTVSVLLAFSLLLGTWPADAVTFQQVPTAGGATTPTQPTVTGQSYGPAVPGSAVGPGDIVRDTSAPLDRFAAEHIGKAYREMALGAVEAHVDLSNFIYADPVKTPEMEMEVRYERCMKSLDNLEKRARRVNQAVDMSRIAALPLIQRQMPTLADMWWSASPACAALSPKGGVYGINQTGIFSPIKQITSKIARRVKQIKSSLPSSKVDTKAVRDQVGRWLSAVKAGAGFIAGAATFTAGATLVVTATPLGIAVGVPMAVGGLLGGADAIITGTEDMQSVSEEDLGYEIMPSDSPERKAIAKGAKIGNYISIVTSVKSAGEFVTSVLQAPNEAVEAAAVAGTPVGNALADMLSGGGKPSSGLGVAGGSAVLAGPEPPLCPGTYIGSPGMKPGHIDESTKAYEKIKKAVSGYNRGFGRGPTGKDWWDAIWDATGANDGGGGEGGGGGGCGCGH